MSEYSDETFEEIKRLEGMVDKFEDKTSTYLIKIAAQQMSAKESREVTELLHTIGDVERISDHALNIAEAAKEIHDKEITFSEQATKDIAVITSAATEILSLTISAFIEENIDALKNIEPLEQVIDDLKRKIKNGHISRLRAGDCTMELGFILSDILTNYERVSDHCSNIAGCVMDSKEQNMNLHESLKHIRSDSAFYREKYTEYTRKYLSFV